MRMQKMSFSWFGNITIFYGVFKIKKILAFVRQYSYKSNRLSVIQFA